MSRKRGRGKKKMPEGRKKQPQTCDGREILAASTSPGGRVRPPPPQPQKKKKSGARRTVGAKKRVMTASIDYRLIGERKDTHHRKYH